MATNAARYRMVAGKHVKLLEFGLRRAQGPDGGLSASKYSYTGTFVTFMAAAIKNETFTRPTSYLPPGCKKPVTTKVNRVRAIKHFFGIAELHADSSLSIKKIMQEWGSKQNQS